VVDPVALLKEIDSLEGRGVSVRERLHVSNRAHLIFPYHRLIEKESDKTVWRLKLGTTQRGIGPAYEDKMARHGVRVGDLLDESSFRCLVDTAVQEKQATLRGWGSDAVLDVKQVVEEYLALCAPLRPLITDTALLLNREIDEGISILLEGAQGTQLDVDHGTYPYVTSSSATAGGACTGTGIPPTRISGVVGVSKAYATRVGGGPFPTEDKTAAGELLRECGREYGSVTGRSRRCGWMDIPILRYSRMVNGLTSLIITKLDVLDGLDEVPVCTAYDFEGSITDQLPCGADDWEKLRPVYQKFPGWKQPTFGLTRLEDLPKQARAYLDFIGARAEVDISIVSTGPDRNQSIWVAGSCLEKLLPPGAPPRG
jgi:adenylosuccinate synthase